MERHHTTIFICLLAIAAIAVPALAQSGFPLKGTWSGDWGPSKSDRYRLLLEFDWDGKTLSGTLNPGPDAAKMTNVRVEPPAKLEDAAKGWPVHFEADAKNAAGQMVHIVADGTLENIGAFKKFITGTWVEGNKKGYFEVTRN